MFTESDLQTALKNLDESMVELLDIVELDEYCFSTPASEQFIFACRGSKTHFQNAAEVWLLSLRPAKWANRKRFVDYVEAGSYLPISPGGPS